MQKELYAEMYRLEEEHWWFSAKRKIVLSVISKFQTGKPKTSMKICDLGCGCGMMLVDLSRQGYEVIGIDSNQDAVDYCRKRNLPVKNCSITRTELPAESFDCVLLLDVLEHLDSESEVLVEAEKILKKGGLLICTVPSYKWLWTQRDNFHHHKRRYCRKQLSDLFVSLTNMQILILSYMNTFLFPIAAVARLYQKLFPSNKEPCDLFIPAMGINKIFRAVFAGERFFINNKMSLPFGVSLILVARKK